MDKQVKIVIGANYGDEGKGLVSYSLADKANREGRKVLTVLYNGGAQRGHTAGGKVHHCTGSGISVGTDTYYDSHFMLDPITVWLERAKVYFNPLCRVVLPCDVINNQINETRARKIGADNGTCGMGIFEACKRSQNHEYEIIAADLIQMATLYDKLIKCEQKYGYPRDILYNNDNFMRAVEWVNLNCRLIDFASLMKENDYDTIIFEGGQGLMLDQANRGDYPHLTPSSTGIRNCIRPIRQLKVVPDIYYVSRSYLTRHGRGHLPGECKVEDINKDIVDETNVTNIWQGELRYGYLGVEALHDRIWSDAAEYNTWFGKNLNVNLVYTHLNYTDGKLAVGKKRLDKIVKPSFVSHIYGSDRKDEMGVLV